MPKIAEPIEWMEEPPNRLRWTRQKRDAVCALGILTEPHEIFDGYILTKPDVNPSHSTTIIRLQEWLSGLFGAAQVQTQDGIATGDADLEYNAPEPDLAVAKQPLTTYEKREPGGNDLLLVVEVSETTLRFDLALKASLYARSGILDYWVVDIPDRQVFVHRQPSAEGYAEISVYSEEASLATLTRPDTFVVVRELLPPPQEAEGAV